MTISSLRLRHVRNFETISLSFSPRTTIIVGPNGVGKTNVLEGIDIVATSKSFRRIPDFEIIQWGYVVGWIEGVVEGGGSKTTRTVTIGVREETGQTEKHMTVNGVVRGSVQFIGQFPVLVFTPHDVELLPGPPVDRRYHIDMLLAMTDGSYKRAITQYSHHMRERNRLLEQLRDGNGERGELAYWDEQLATNGTLIMDGRKQFFDFANKNEKPFGKFDFTYIPSVQETALLDRFAETHDRDIAAGMTLSGPHRDDWRVTLDDHDLAHFGSRGEQRAAILAIKLLEVMYVENIRGERPVLLLDDIFSELDDLHRQHIFGIVNKQQTIITTTDERLLRGRKDIDVIQLHTLSSS